SWALQTKRDYSRRTVTSNAFCSCKCLCHFTPAAYLAFVYATKQFQGLCGRPRAVQTACCSRPKHGSAARDMN
ncbi:MAG: hypothetical protein ACK55I_12750, partial [bacterium]